MRDPSYDTTWHRKKRKVMSAQSKAMTATSQEAYEKAEKNYAKALEALKKWEKKNPSKKFRR